MPLSTYTSANQSSAPTLSTACPKACLTVIVLWLTMGSGYTGDWIMVENAKVNGTPVRMAFDTGADGIYLFSPTPKRLQLKVSPMRNLWGQKLCAATEKCTVQFWNFSEKQRVAVLDAAPFVQNDDDTLDGVVGWEAVFDKVLVFDTVSNTVQFVREVPKEVTRWTKLSLGWASILSLKVPDHGRTGRIIIDTGSASGVGLSPSRWSEWKNTHSSRPVTLDASYMPGPQLFVVREQAWAQEFLLGPLLLTDVVLETADPVSLKQAGKRHTATLGLTALKRLDLVVDGGHDVAYVRSKTTVPERVAHNRAGAVFVPLDRKSDTLVARVADGGPAYEAGIRNGDVVLKVGEQAVTNWRTTTNRPRTFWEQPGGTRIPLTVERNNETLTKTIILRDILPPATEVR